MRDDDKTDLPGWLGLKRTPDFDKARWLVSALSVVVIVLFGMAVLVVFAVLGHALFGLGMNDVPRIGFGTGAVAVALIGAPFVIWRSVVAQKTVSLQEQGHITDRINTAVQGLGAQKEVNQIGRPVLFQVFDPDGAERYECQTEIEWKGHVLQIPDGMYAAEEGKWQVFTETQPNLEVRIGAIYALERIAQDSDRDHVQIMEILCAYIRQNAPAPVEDEWPELEMKDGEDKGPLEADWQDRLTAFRQAQNEAKKNLKPREDIQTALTVIGRRSARQRRLEAGRGQEAVFPFDVPCPVYDGPEDDHHQVALTAFRGKLNTWKVPLRDYAGYRLDLRETDLMGADLSKADLKGVRLERAFLQGTNLAGARLQGAVLWEARLQGARLSGTRLQGADFEKAQLQGARLGAARLQGATLNFARLQGAVLDHARLQGAALVYARLQGTGLKHAGLQGAYLGLVRLDKNTDLMGSALRGAAVSSVDFTNVPQISAHVQKMFGDASVTLPSGHGPGHEDWPPHWPRKVLRQNDFKGQWRKWQADPKGYTLPDPSETDDPA